MYCYGKKKRFKIENIEWFQKFYQYCLKGYLLFVLYLPFYYVLGLTENNGEAIVRIYTLSSVIALVIDGKVSSIYIFYALIVHCLCNVRIRDFFKKLLC